MIRVRRSDNSGQNSRRAGYLTVKLALREDAPVLSVSVYLPAGRVFPFCLRVRSKDQVPVLLDFDARTGAVLAHALLPAQRITMVTSAAALSA